MPVVKTLIWVIIWVVYAIIESIYYPVVDTQVALTQLNDSWSSFTNYQLIQNAFRGITFILMMITTVSYVPNIRKFINNIKNKNNKEEETK